MELFKRQPTKGRRMHKGNWLITQKSTSSASVVASSNAPEGFLSGLLSLISQYNRRKRGVEKKENNY
jgi:hypothetical protein